MSKAFLDIADPGQLQRAVLGLERAVARSFEADRARMTAAEVRRRGRLVARRGAIARLRHWA